jgi:hypothetical protein
LLSKYQTEEGIGIKIEENNEVKRAFGKIAGAI